MKYTLIKTSLALFLIILLTNSLNAQNSQYTEAEAKFYANYAKLTNCAEKPLNINCKKCLNPGDGYKFYFFYQTTRINKFNYKFMIHYNDIQKKLLFTFSGPSVNNHIYIKYIYSAGFNLVKRYKFQIEKEFYQIYFKKIRKILYSKILKINSSGRKNFTANFVGHSIGASLATLAAFDMQQLKLIQNPKVFAFAPLRLGDATFVALVNSYVTVYRIVKKSDYIVRIPNCYFSPTYKVWRCFNEKIVREFIAKPNFPLKIYVKSYLTYFNSNNIILHKAIMYARKKLGFPKESNKNSKSNKIGKRSIEKNKKKDKKSLIKNKKIIANVKKDIKNKKDILKALRLQKKKLSKTLKNLDRNIKKSKSNNIKSNTKKAKKINKKISKDLNKLNKSKSLPKKIKKSMKKLLNKKNKKLLKVKPTDKKQKAKILKKLNKFLRKAESVTKKIKKHIQKVNKKIKSLKGGKKTNKITKTDKNKKEKKTKLKKTLRKKSNKKGKKIKKSQTEKQLKKKKEIMIKKVKKSGVKKQLRKKSDNKEKKDKKSTKKQKKEEKKGKKNLSKDKKISPIKKVSSISKKQAISPLVNFTYIPSYTEMKVYTPIDTYFTFIYYTQPIGYQIFYNDAMTEYTHCQYSHGISQCEKIITLPNDFSSESHITYFNINFEKCK